MMSRLYGVGNWLVLSWMWQVGLQADVLAVVAGQALAADVATGLAVGWCGNWWNSWLGWQWWLGWCDSWWNSCAGSGCKANVAAYGQLILGWQWWLAGLAVAACLAGNGGWHCSWCVGWVGPLAKLSLNDWIDGLKLWMEKVTSCLAQLAIGWSLIYLLSL